jgi:uncharacterized protein (DUF362 family)
VTIAVIHNQDMKYPLNPPYDPGNRYPEYPFTRIGKENSIYHEIRNILLLLKLDRENYHRDCWNPLGNFIKPGNSVILKPNFVTHDQGMANDHSLITHGSIIRAILDYVYIALEGKGHVSIADAPILTANFSEIVKNSGLIQIVDIYKNSDIIFDIIDLREQSSARSGKISHQEGSNQGYIKGDPLGYSWIDLNEDSELLDIFNVPYVKAPHHQAKEIGLLHNKQKNAYSFSNSILHADVIINLAKLKTHKKTGLSCSMKGSVGMIGDKNCIPHYRLGSLEENGDEYCYKSTRKRLISRIYDRIATSQNEKAICLYSLVASLINSSHAILPYKDPYFVGDWYGNDTLPRVIADLNKILLYSDNKGNMNENIQRSLFNLVDGVVAGEGDGPLQPVPKNCGLLVAGFNSLEVDLACCSLMGFDYQKIPMFQYALNSKHYSLFGGDLRNIKIVLNDNESEKTISEAHLFDFLAPYGWKNHIEQVLPDRTLNKPMHESDDNHDRPEN